jgi:hypothetical protein
MVPIIWLLDRGILEKLSYDRHTIDHYVREAGHEAIFVDRHPDGTYSDPLVANDKCVVLYGSHEFTRYVESHQYQPGALGVNARTQASSYMSNLPLDWFMNRNANMMTWAMFKHRARELFYNFDAGELFIRPNSGLKTFAGHKVKFGTIDHDISSLDQTSSVVDDTLILVNQCQDIQGEFRFVIADKEVITGSEYRWDGKLDIRRDWPEECFTLAEKVAKQGWQVDVAYTCDVALTEEGPKIVELNGFSCAGLYACDLAKVVEGVSRAAAREWAGLDLV